MSELYMAYASADTAIASDFYQALKERGLTDIFYDQIDVAFGEDAITGMERGFQNNLAVLLVWSARALDAPFLKLERLEAIYNAVKGTTELIMPVRLDNTELPTFIKTRSHKCLRSPECPDGESLESIADAVVAALDKYRGGSK